MPFEQLSLGQRVSPGFNLCLLHALLDYLVMLQHVHDVAC